MLHAGRTTTQFCLLLPLPMRIAVNFGMLQSTTWSYFEAAYYLNTFVSLASCQRGHDFLFFLSKPYPTNAPAAENIELVVINLKGKQLPFFGWLFKFKVAGLLKKYRADVCISAEDIFNSGSVMPNILIIPTTPFLHSSASRRNFRGAVNRVNVICTTTRFFKQELIRYKVPETKILNVEAFVEPIFKPVEWSNKEIIKEAYADGYEYFLLVYSHAKDDVIPALKAFSIFKKWQKTNMKLLIIDDPSTTSESLVDQLRTFKYREEVKLLKVLSVDESAKVYAGAYGILFPCTIEVFPFPVLQAMQCETPVITSAINCTKEVGEDAVLYANPTNPEDMAEQLKKIYKDEQLRSDLIARGSTRSALYSAERTTDLMWAAIEQAVSQ